MLDVALNLLASEFNNHLLARTGAQTGAARLTRTVDDSGKYAIEQDTIGLTVLNIEEERLTKAHTPDFIYRDGRHVVQPPVLKLNLSAMFAANFRVYDQALKHLAIVLGYFQTHPVFTPDEHPAQDPRIEKLVVELQSLTFEQLNQVWGFIGAKQLPAVFYRVRMVILEPEIPTGLQLPITTIQTTIGDR